MALLADLEHVYYMLKRGANFRKKDRGGVDIAHHVFNYHINKDEFPLLAHGVKDPRPLKPKNLTPEEQEEWRTMYKKALEADIKRRGC